MSRSLGPSGEALIKSFEAYRSTAYPDEGGVPTIGWGHTGPDVTLYMAPCTMSQAQAWFDQDTAHCVAVLSDVLGPTVTQNQFDACVSLAYNIGTGAFLHSTLLAKFRAGDTAGASGEFPKWDNVAGTPSAGLLRRRQAEQTLFNL
jgi:lysozyme